MKPTRKFKVPTEERLIRQAVYYLERYATSVENLRRVLERKVARAARANDLNEQDFSELIDSVIAKCERSGMVDDRRFAETKVASQRRRGYSSRQITAKLQSRGVKADVVEDVLRSHELDDAQAAIVMARRKRIGPWRTRGNRSDFRDKDMAALCRAGFSFENARRIIDGDVEDLLAELEQ
ncbi:regulatory protein RecX [Roseibium sp.]|uniref:regulatory protein RecX n=1 Tax=Roseibium sp. TaxID=1936156 RepID=UPI003A96AB05